MPSTTLNRPNGVVLAQAPCCESAPSCGSGDIPLIVDQDHLRVLLESGRMAALGELAGLIMVDGVLSAPTAIFQGLRRPFKGEGVDNFVFAYVSRPDRTYKFKPNPRNARVKPDVLVPPAESVFVTFVTLARQMVEGTQRNPHWVDGEVRGVVLGWEWTLASHRQPDLPDGHGQRYRRRVWPWNL